MPDPIPIGTAAVNWAALALGQQRTIADLIAVFGAQQRTIDAMAQRLDERDTTITELIRRVERLETDTDWPSTSSASESGAGDHHARRP